MHNVDEPPGSVRSEFEFILLINIAIPSMAFQ